MKTSAVFCMYHLMTFLENHWSPKVRQMRVKSETSHFIKALFSQFSQVARLQFYEGLDNSLFYICIVY